MKSVIASSTPGCSSCQRGSFFKHAAKSSVPKLPEHQEQGDQQAKIADAVDDEGFLGSLGVANAILAFFKPETDQQVRAQPHAFPADKQHQVVIGADQDHHRGNEQVEVDKEAAEAPGSSLWRTSSCMYPMA